MREVFAVTERPPVSNEVVFYTIRHADIGKTVIVTTEGPIQLGDFMGRVRNIDVGKRLVRVPVKDGTLWQVENQQQYEKRTRKEGP